MSKKNKHRQNINTPKIKDLLSIVICVYGRFDLLDRCLKSIPDATDGITYNIILVDNNSPEQAEADIFYQSISDNRQNIRIIRNKTNVGFPKACNQGSRQSNSPLLFMLNSDVILESSSIKYMVQQLDNPKVGVVGMKLLFPEYAEGLRQDKNVRPAGKIQHVGLETNIRGEFYHIFLGWNKEHPKVCETRSTYAVTGAALMTRRILWERIKGFNEEYGLGCLVGDTYIITHSGIRQLNEFGDMESGLYPISIDIASEYSIENSNFFFVNGEHETLKVKLEKDFSIHGTPNHKVRCISEEGVIVWKQLDELKIGDFVGIRYGTNMFGDNKMPPDSAYFCGLYLAEGSFETAGRIAITSKDDEIQKFLVDRYAFSSTDKDRIHWRRQDVDLSSWLSRFVDLTKKAINKEISSFFLGATRDVQIALLQGMFDGDGCAIKDGRINYSTSSYKMAKQIQMMLLNFGIVVGIYSRESKIGKTNYLLDFGSDSGLFYSAIGFRLSRKQERHSLVRDRRSTIIPYQREHFNTLYGSFPIGQRNWNEFGPHSNNPSSNVRRNTIQMLLDDVKTKGDTWLNNNTVKHFESILIYDCAWLKVKSIEDGGIQETFDLHVPSNHAYIANGFIVHNTFEDVDYCLSVRELGLDVIIETKAVGVHFTNATAEKYNIGYPMEVNRMLLLRRWANKLQYTEINAY